MKVNSQKNLLKSVYFCKLNKAIKYCMTSFDKKYNNFAIKLGGIDNDLSMKKFTSNLSTFRYLFKGKLIDDFKMAYVNTLRGFQDKDKSYLSNILEQKLIKDVQIPKMSLVNTDSHIKIDIGVIRMCYGLQFDRSKHPKNATVFNFMQQNLQLIKAQKMMDINNQIITSLIIQVYFRSKIKLLRSQFDTEQNSQQIQELKQKEELHMFQFQIEQKVSKWSMLKRMLLLLMNINNKQKLVNMFGDIWTQNLPSNSVWKISDIDMKYNSNLPKLIQPSK